MSVIGKAEGTGPSGPLTLDLEVQDLVWQPCLVLILSKESPYSGPIPPFEMGKYILCHLMNVICFLTQWRITTKRLFLSLKRGLDLGTSKQYQEIVKD